MIQTYTLISYSPGMRYQGYEGDEILTLDSFMNVEFAHTLEELTDYIYNNAYNSTIDFYSSNQHSRYSYYKVNVQFTLLVDGIPLDYVDDDLINIEFTDMVDTQQTKALNDVLERIRLEAEKKEAARQARRKKENDDKLKIIAKTLTLEDIATLKTIKEST